MDGLTSLESTGGMDVRGVHIEDPLTGLSLDPGEPLTWRRTVPLGSEFELRQGSSLIGEMERDDRKEVDASGECLGQTWDLRMESGLFRRIRIETTRSFGDKAGPTYDSRSFGRGRIRTATGELLRWRKPFFSFSDYILLDSAGTLLIRLRPAFFSLLRTETTVIVTRPAWRRPDIASLLLLAWFIRVHARSGGSRVFRR